MQDTDLLLVRLELTIEGSRTPAIAGILRVQGAQLVHLVEHAMERTGKRRSPVGASTLIAAIDGVLLRALREEPRRRADLLRDALELLMSSLMETSTGSARHAVS